MSEPNTLGPGAQTEAKVPWWDYLLLPVLALFTICALAFTTEFIAHQIFPAKGDMKDCLVWNDRATGVRGIPNCVCREKVPEGQWVEYRFNRCGDYTAIDCERPKPEGTYRIVMTGTSFPVGLGVSREKTFAVLLPEDLSQTTGRKVELYNTSLPRKSPRAMDLQFNEMLALKPDLILFALNYADIQLANLAAGSDYVPENVAPPAAARGSAVQRALTLRSALLMLVAKIESAGLVFLHEINNSWAETRSYVLVTELMTATESQSQFVKSSRTSEGQYLSVEPSQARLMHLKEFDGYFGDMANRARAAGVPVAAVLLPTRLQAAMISSGQWPAGIDPFQFDNQLRAIVESHGGIYIDVLPDLRTEPDALRWFFPADGHFNSGGHAIAAQLLAKELTRGAVPGLSVAAHSEAAQEQSR